MEMMETAAKLRTLNNVQCGSWSGDHQSQPRDGERHHQLRPQRHGPGHTRG